MADRLTVRLTPSLVKRLDQVAARRGLHSRAAAARALILEGAMDSAEREALPDRDELLRLLSDKARSSANTAAIRLLLEEQRREQAGQPKRQPSVIDELAKRRGRE